MIRIYVYSLYVAIKVPKIVDVTYCHNSKLQCSVPKFKIGFEYAIRLYIYIIIINGFRGPLWGYTTIRWGSVQYKLIHIPYYRHRGSALNSIVTNRNQKDIACLRRKITFPRFLLVNLWNPSTYIRVGLFY